MAEYHVKMESDNMVYAGTMKGKKFANKSEVTQEVLEAAKDHLLAVSKAENKEISYAWELNNGKILLLKLEVKDKSDIKDSEEEIKE